MSRFSSEDGFNIQLYSGSEFERLVAEVYFQGKYVATVAQEQTLGEFEVLFPDNRSNENAITRRIDLRGFAEALDHARTALIERSGEVNESGST